MIRNIVFDMGNVLVKFDPDLFMDREGIQDPEDRKQIRNELFRSAEWSMMDLGMLDENSAEPLVLKRLPERLHPAVRRLLHNWSNPRTMMDGMEDLVRRLKDAGYRIYLLSNASVSQPDYWDPLPVSKLFDGTLISANLHMVKPMNEIYRAFTDRFGLIPEECVFIDDASMNIACAIANGWHGIVFHGEAADAERKLREMGVQF